MKNQPENSRSRRVIGWLNTLVVFVCLAGIGWWGHHSHWQLPGGKSHATAPTAAGTKASSAVANPQPSAEEKTSPSIVLPAISFETPEGARSCGIATDYASLLPMDDQIIANGEIAYDRSRLAQLAARVPGSVFGVVKRLGDPVSQGEVLALIDSADVGEAKANLLEAAVLFQLKSQHLQRISQVKDVVPGKKLVELEAEIQLARTQRFTAMQKLINLGFDIRLSEIESLSVEALASHLHRLGLPDNLAVDAHSNNLIPIKAPFDGLVTQCEVVRGEVVEPARPLYVIADISEMWISLSIRQDDADRLKLGAPVEFESEMNHQKVTGILNWIGTEVDPRTRTIQARAEFKNLPQPNAAAAGTPRRSLLSAGVFGTARILNREQPHSLVIPNSSLHYQWELGQEVAFIADEDGRTFRPRIVTKGLTRSGFVQILSGLEPGARVVTDGSRILSAELSEQLQQLRGNEEASRTFQHVSSLE